MVDAGYSMLDNEWEDPGGVQVKKMEIKKIGKLMNDECPMANVQ